MSVRIVPVELADLNDLVALEKRLFGADAWSAQVFAEELQHPFSYYRAAELDGKIVGYAGLRAALSDAGHGDIQTIAVVEESRGRGLGRRLLEAVLDEARHRGVIDLFLEVRADNPVAIGLYESVGFAEIDRRAGYYQPDGVDAIVMQLNLDSAGWKGARAGE